MDPRFIALYRQELRHLRDVGAEFAKDNELIAGRLSLDEFECQDPYVERLLEGFSFLAARVQLRQDSEYPRFTQHLLEMLYPHYLAPLPSMVNVAFHPDFGEGALADGVKVERSTILRSVLGRGETTACEFRTAHELILWPLEIARADYIIKRDLPALQVECDDSAQAAIRIVLKSRPEFGKVAIDELAIHLRGSDHMPMLAYEQIIGNCTDIVYRRPDDGKAVRCPRTHVRSLGFDEEEALLPSGGRALSGYRLLTEFFAFPTRFMYVEFQGLAEAVRGHDGHELEIIVFVNRHEDQLESAVSGDHFDLHCVPAINLFPKRLDRIHVEPAKSEFHLVADRTRPLDFEIYSVDEVVGYHSTTTDERRFLPFYSLTDTTILGDQPAYYTVERSPRRPSERWRQAPLSSYIGSELSISIVDPLEAPYPLDLKQLGVRAYCTNRHLPLTMTRGIGRTDFTLECGAPVESVRCVEAPTEPKPAIPINETTWRLINHLTLNHSGLFGTADGSAPEALREMLRLYAFADRADGYVRRQIDGVNDLRCKQVLRRVPTPGPIAFARGVQVTLECREANFEGSGVFLFGSVLEQLFARLVSLNSFSELVLRTLERGEVHRWPPRAGRLQML